jgi:hypothetical protein
MNPMELPRDLSKLLPKFRKPLNVEEILEELYSNEPRGTYCGAVDVEPEVTLEEGRRFAFVFSLRHNGPFLFVECAKGEVDFEYYNSRPERFHDFILMDIYAIGWGGPRVQCISLECCVKLHSLVHIMPLSCSLDVYHFPLAPSRGNKGDINKAWHAFAIAVKTPGSLDAWKYKMPDGTAREVWARIAKHKEDPRLLKFVKDLGATVRTGVPMDFKSCDDLENLLRDPGEGSQFTCNANITVHANRAPDPSEPVEPYYGPRKDPNRFTK